MGRFERDDFWNEPWMQSLRHVVIGWGEGSKHVLGYDDHVHSGQVSIDPAVHLRFRSRHWRDVSRRVAMKGPKAAPLGILDKVEVAAASATPIVLWRTPRWSCLLATAHLLHTLARVGVDPAQLSIAELPTMRTVEGTRMPVGSAFWWSMAAARDRKRAAAHQRAVARAFDRRHPLTRRMLLAEGSLWPRFCAPSPRPVLQWMDRAGVARWQSYLAAFPRDRGGPRPRISLVDQWLLGALCTGTHRSFVDVIRLRGMPHAWDWGDVELFDRLLLWTAGSDPFVARHHDPAGRSPMSSQRLVLTPRGARLLRDGIDDLSALPPLFVGGHQVYDPSAPWVVRGGRLAPL